MKRYDSTLCGTIPGYGSQEIILLKSPFTRSHSYGMRWRPHVKGRGEKNAHRSNLWAVGSRRYVGAASQSGHAFLSWSAHNESEQCGWKQPQQRGVGGTIG